MTQAESKLSRKIMAALRARGYFCFKVHGSEYMMAGLPDIIACVDGYFFSFETKLPEERKNVSPRQALVHSQISNSGGVAIVVCSAAEALAAIDKTLKKK